MDEEGGTFNLSFFQTRVGLALHCFLSAAASSLLSLISSVLCLVEEDVPGLGGPLLVDSEAVEVFDGGRVDFLKGRDGKRASKSEFSFINVLMWYLRKCTIFPRPQKGWWL